MSGRPASERVIPGRNAISVGNPCSPLKPGWTWAPLSSLAELGTGHTPSRLFAEYWDGDVPWIGLRDAGRHHGGVIQDTEQRITELGLANSAARWLPKDTVCLSRTASVGYVVKMGRAMATSQDFVTWSCGAALDPDYLMRALLAEGRDIRRFGNGSTHTTIYFPEVKAFHIALPPLPEQRRIVAKLEALDASSKRARADLDRIPALAARAKQAILAKAFDEPQPRKTLGELILSLDQGWSPKCDKEPAHSDAEWAVMTTTAIQPIAFDSRENKLLPADLQPRPTLEIHADDVLMTRAGPRSRLGIVCHVAQTRPRLMLCDKAYRLRFSAKTDPKFVTLMCNAPQIQGRIENMKSGGNDSGLNLTQAKVLSLSVPAPTISEQREIVRRIEAAFAQIDRAAAEAASASKLLDRLDQALLAKAFRGELAPQDPDDEPASALLARIRASRKPQATTRGRKKLAE